jgi:serine/threonine-protein kinase RsbW
MALSEAVIGLEASYPAQPPQVAVIRRTLSAIARRCGADTETLIRLELAISEAATNVVLHAYRSPGERGEIHIAAHVDDGVLDVCVRDTGSGMYPRPDSPGMGLGLSLMAGEADGFEVRSVDGGGTEVLLRFGLRSRPPRPRRRMTSTDRAGVGARA